MRKPLGKNTVLKLQNTDRTYMIDSVLGVGANSIVYSACWEDSFGLPHFVRIKELCPAKAEIDRNDDGSLTWNTDSERDAALQHFEGEYEKHQLLSSWQDTINSTVQYQESLLYGNGTAYMIMGTDNGKPYSEVADANLHELFKTLLALAKAVALYHEKGMLLLDIKPENFLVLPETRELVKLFDFDSVVSERKVADLDTSISYSYDYAAPELRLGKRKSICKATDYYGVGSIAFSRIMNRFPEADDCLRFSDWDLSDNSLFSSTSPKSQRLIKAFFRKTLASHANARYSSDQELIDALQSIVEETVPGRCFLYSARRAPLASFIGREQELGKIHAAFTGDANVVFLRGLGGIGKTELAKAYGKRFENEYDTVCFGTFKTDTDALLRDQSFISFANVPVEAVSAEDNLRRLSLTDSHTLLIVDDYSFAEDDALFENLLSLPCRVLITTREQTKDLFANEQTIRHITLGSLQADEQWDLFTVGYHGFLMDEEKQKIEKLFDAVDGHTMFIDLFAKNLQASGLSVSEAVSRFEKNGLSEISKAKIRSMKDGTKTDTIEGYFRTLFDMSNLSYDAKRALSCLALLGDIHIDKRFLCKLSDSNIDALNLELINRGWVRYVSELDEVAAHTIVMKTARDRLKPTISSFPVLSNMLHELADAELEEVDTSIERSDMKNRILFLQAVILNGVFEKDEDTRHVLWEYSWLCKNYFDTEDTPMGSTIFDDKIQERVFSLVEKIQNPNTLFEAQRISLYYSLYRSFYSKESRQSSITDQGIDAVTRELKATQSLLYLLEFAHYDDSFSHQNFVVLSILTPIGKALDHEYINADSFQESRFTELALVYKEIVDDFINFDVLCSYQRDEMRAIWITLQPTIDYHDHYYYPSFEESSAAPSDIHEDERSEAIQAYERKWKEDSSVESKITILREVIDDLSLTLRETGEFLGEFTNEGLKCFYLFWAYSKNDAGKEEIDYFSDSVNAEQRIRLASAVCKSLKDYNAYLEENYFTLYFADDDEFFSIPDHIYQKAIKDGYTVWLSEWTSHYQSFLIEQVACYLVMKDTEKAIALADEAFARFSEVWRKQQCEFSERETFDFHDSIIHDYVHLERALILTLRNMQKYDLCSREIDRYCELIDRNDPSCEWFPITMGTDNELFEMYGVGVKIARQAGDRDLEIKYQNKRNLLRDVKFRYDN